MIQNEASREQCNDIDKPRYTGKPLILGRYALTGTYKYLDIGISVGLISHVEIILGDKRGNQIILPRATLKEFIKKCEDVERFLESDAVTTGSWLPTRDLVFELVEMCDEDMAKLTLHDT